MTETASGSNKVHPDLSAHTAQMKKKVYTVRDHIHTAYAFSPSNCTLIEGDGASILVDTLPTEEYAEPVAEAFRKISDKPIQTVIFTHFHNDHVGGVFQFVSEDDVRAGRVEVVGQQDLTENILRDSGLIAPILGRRAVYQFGVRLPEGEEGTVGIGIGPINRVGKRGFVAPTRTFKDNLELEVAGVRIELVHVPSETDDQIVVWLPDEKVLISADVIQGETFPNAYALRGTRYRDPLMWVKAIDRLRAFGAEILLPHHGRPVEGADAVEDVLVSYRDALQFMHDQTVRLINKGYTPDEIKDEISMPSHLADHPWLGEYYGSYKHSIPSIYAGYIGWFHGDPVELDPLPRRERARRYIDLIGGRDRILTQAREAIDAGEFQWAAELAGWPVRADPDDMEARSVKAEALREYGYRQKNATWRNWSLTAALELEGELTWGPQGLPIGTPTQVRSFPLGGIVEILTTRLKAEEAIDMRLCVAFETTDTDESCALEIRRGICQYHEAPPPDVAATVRFDRPFLTRWVFGQASFDEGLADGTVSVEGDASALSDLLDKFEPITPGGNVRIAAR